MTETTQRKPKPRSPSYPAISLLTAIQRAEVVYKKERQHPFPVSNLPKTWGYKSLNGPASTTLAALKKYGLLEDEGSLDERTARITDLAVEILANPDKDARANAVQHAALLPTIHEEMWARYKSELPADDTLIWELTRQRSFTETGAREFVREYKETLEFAQLEGARDETSEQDEIDDPSLDIDPDDASAHAFTNLFAPQPATPTNSPAPAVPVNAPQPASPAPSPAQAMDYKPQPGRDAYKVPIGGGRSVDVVGDFPLTEQDWALFMAVLTAMKPGLVLPTEPTG